MDHLEKQERPYHHGDLRRAILDAAEHRLITKGGEGLTIRACARAAGVSPAAPIHHFGSLRGLLSALAARGFDQLVAQLDADLLARREGGASVLVGAYVAFAVSQPGMFDLMWRDGILNPDDDDLSHARRVALERLQTQARPTHGSENGSRESRIGAIRSWSLAHGLATLLLHGRIVKALGAPELGLEATQDFALLASDPRFSGF